MVLNRNPDNFFAETEQVAFCTAHVVPGIDFTNDPLLAGRIHSYVDTQISRLGGPNFHEIPINAPVAQVHNNQRDGMHRQAVHRGRVSYEPNSLGGGCPFQAGSAGFVSFPEPVEQDEVRGKPEKFAEHFNQAALFFNSQTPVEQAHIVAAFRFELSKLTVPAIRRRVISMLRNASEDLAAQVADGLGMELPEAMPRALPKPPKAEVATSEALSMFARPGQPGIATRKVAIFVGDGVNGDQVAALQKALLDGGAVGRLVGHRVGTFTAADGSMIDADASFENEPSVLFDAVAIPDGEGTAKAWARDGRAAEFVKDQFRHLKTILALGDAVSFVEGAGVLRDEENAGLLLQSEPEASFVSDFVDALARHKHFNRETDPPVL
jgi:catalase